MAGPTGAFKYVNEEHASCRRQGELGETCVYGICCNSDDPGCQDAKSLGNDKLQKKMLKQTPVGCNNGGKCMQRPAHADSFGRPYGWFACDSSNATHNADLIHESKMCDGTSDCAGGEDETSCLRRSVEVRFCQCEDDWYGGNCSMQMSPGTPLMYGLLSLVVSTLFFFGYLALYHNEQGATINGMGDVLAYAKTHLLTVSDATGDGTNGGTTPPPSVDSRILSIAATAALTEQLMMVAAVLSRSVAWSRDFLLVEILQDVMLTLIDLFTAITAFILPKDWLVHLQPRAARAAHPTQTCARKTCLNTVPAMFFARTGTRGTPSRFKSSSPAPLPFTWPLCTSRRRCRSMNAPPISGGRSPPSAGLSMRRAWVGWHRNGRRTSWWSTRGGKSSGSSGILSAKGRKAWVRAFYRCS